MKRGGSCIESMGVGKIAVLKARAYVEKNCPNLLRKYSPEIIHGDIARDKFLEEIGDVSNYAFMPYTDLIGVDHFTHLSGKIWKNFVVRLKTTGIFLVYNHEWEIGKMVMPNIDTNGKRKKGVKELFIIKIR